MLPGPMRRLPTTTVYLIYVGLSGFLFRLGLTVFAVFLIRDLELNPLQLLLMGTIVEVSYLLFEVPTGVVADTVSRRLSVLIGLFGVGVAFLLLGSSTSFLAAALSQVVWGIFATFESGADIAWLTDEIGEEQAHHYYLKGEQVFQLASLLGIAMSVLLANAFDLRVPILLTGAGVLCLGVLMAAMMREEHFHPREREEGERLHQGLVRTFRAGLAEVRGHRILLLVLAVAALHGASTEGFDRLADLHFLSDIGLPPIGDLDTVVWFGVLDGVGLVLGIAAIQIVKKRVRLEGHALVARVLGVFDVALVVTVVIFAMTGTFWLAAAAFWLVGGLRSVREPVFRAWVNQGLDPRTRATINSMATQSDAIGQASGGPVLGVIATRISVPWAIAVSGLLRVPALLLYARAIRRGTVGTITPSEEEPLELEE
jgi:DHA3 family tetracycline resistance protein-like MFS transporter